MWKSYRDQWVSEGLAAIARCWNWKREIRQLFGWYWTTMRFLLLEKDGRPTWEAGRSFGPALNFSYFPVGYDVVAYGRGAWLFYMLREMLRDEDKSRSGSPIEIHEEKFTQVLRRVSKIRWKAYVTRELLLEFEADWPNLCGTKATFLDWFWMAGYREYRYGSSSKRRQDCAAQRRVWARAHHAI